VRVLDLFCGAGLAADGYAAVGFDVTGVDLAPQPDYTYRFIQADALAYLRDYSMHDVTRLDDFDLIHASPPCQAFTRAAKLRDAQGGVSRYPDLLSPTLALLRRQRTPWVVENVPGAPMPADAVRLCGSSFGLDVQRHRLFAASVPLDPVSGKPRPWGVYHVPSDSIPSGGRTARDAAHAAELFRCRALPWQSIKEGFPPEYTTYIGVQAAAFLEARNG
jgi:DNA (cytosine-5)-methyltransferase 1